VPLDEQLDLPAGEVTPLLAERALHLATHMSFVELQASLKLHYDVALSDSVLDRLMQRVGAVSVADAAQRVRALRTVEYADREALVKQRPARPPKRLYVSVDGALYPSRNREENSGQMRILYQEMKCGTVFWENAQGGWGKRVLGGRDSVADFGLRLWELAVQQGLLEADEVIFISDGGAWCETIAQDYFRGATRILDWYHLSQHIWETAHALYDTDEPAAQRWAGECLERLKESSGIGLLRLLQHSRLQRAGTELVALDALLGYLEPRLAYTDYVDYENAGYTIGSGAMEATCKQLVCQRLKGSGRQWSERGATSMVHLVAHRLNHTWTDFWNSRPLQRAA
jgi:hypothetical protein